MRQQTVDGARLARVFVGRRRCCRRERLATFATKYFTGFVYSLALRTAYLKGKATCGTELSPFTIRMTATWADHRTVP